MHVALSKCFYHSFVKVIAITVEDEEDIAKIKDYTPSAPDAGAAADERSSVSASPKKEEVKEPVAPIEPKAPKPSVAPSAEDRIFASPLARNLAEENSV